MLIQKLGRSQNDIRECRHNLQLLDCKKCPNVKSFSITKKQLFIKVIVQKNRVDRYRPARTAQAHFYPQVQEKSDGTLYHEILQSGGKIIDMHIALGT